MNSNQSAPEKETARAANLPQVDASSLIDGDVEVLSFSSVAKSDEAGAVATLVSAFTDDPVERWVYPETQQYLKHFPEFVTAFGGRAFDGQTVWSLGELAAVAFWLPPGAEPDGEAIVAVLTGTVAAAKHADMFAVLEQMELAHPTYPHWYLP